MNPKGPILLTGAAGALGKYLRPRLLERYKRLRISDKVKMDPVAPGEEAMVCDLSDMNAVDKIVKGSGAILHFGAFSVESSWETILHSNIVGTYNVYEAARRHGVKRIIFASTNHVVGFHPSYKTIGLTAAHRPDTYYGVSKAFGEDLGSLYVDKYNLEVACLRIGSALPEPKDIRHLSTWLSYPDLYRMVQACLDAPVLGFTVLYGMSDNDRKWWDNSLCTNVHYRPQDNAEDYAGPILAEGDKRDENDPGRRLTGGPFPADGYVPR